MIKTHYKNVIAHNNIINYKIGGLQIVKNENIDDLFIQNVMNTIRQTNGIEQPFHIDIITNIKDAVKPVKTVKTLVTDLFSFAKSIIMPTKAVVPTYKKLYPLEIYDHSDYGHSKHVQINDDTKENVQIIPKSDLYFKMNKDQIISINNRLSITIPSTECMHDFKVKLHLNSNENNNNINDIRFELLTDNKYIEKRIKNPTVIKW
eukprot:370285_1